MSTTIVGPRIAETSKLTLDELIALRGKIEREISSALDGASPLRIVSVLTSYLPLPSLERALPVITGGASALEKLAAFPEGSEDRRLEAVRQIVTALGGMSGRLQVSILASWLSIDELEENLTRICERKSKDDD